MANKGVDSYIKKVVYYTMNLNKLTHNKLVNLYLTSQGDLTVPPHKRDNPNRELTKSCFVELLLRSSLLMDGKQLGLKGVKR